MKRLIPLFAMLMLACACNSFKTQTYEDEMVMPLEGSAQDSLFYKLSLQYVSGGMSAEATQKVNGAIAIQAFDMEGGSESIEENATAYRENLIDEYINENQGLVDELPVLTWEDMITGEFTKPYKKWKNYIITYSCYRGGAHGYSTFNQIVFDGKSGEVLQESQLFKEAYVEPVAELMREKVKADLQANDPDALEFLEMEYIVPNGNFSLSEDGVNWIFQPDDILPHAFGMLSITLDWEKLKPYLAI